MTNSKREETFSVNGEGLLKKFKELIKEGNDSIKLISLNCNSDGELLNYPAANFWKAFLLRSISIFDYKLDFY